MKKLCCILAIILACTFIFSGCSHRHTYTDASCFSPRACIECGYTTGYPLNHDWITVKCGETKRCQLCGTIESDSTSHNWTIFKCGESKRCQTCGETSLDFSEHSWSNLKCGEAQHCLVCGFSENTITEHAWSAGSSDTPRICSYCGEMKPLELPYSGKVFLGSSLYRGSSITIKSSSDSACYIKLKGTSGNDVFSFFVRAGDTVTVSVPSDYFYVYFSYGTQWYGTEHLFGPETTYSKDSSICDFKNYTWTYTLYPTYSGNFTETPVDENEFK